MSWHLPRKDSGIEPCTSITKIEISVPELDGGQSTGKTLVSADVPKAFQAGFCELEPLFFEVRLEDVPCISFCTATDRSQMADIFHRQASCDDTRQLGRIEDFL